MSATQTQIEAAPGRRPAAGGFTLAELLVVVGIIAIVASVALPSIATIFNAGADAQAFNLLSAQLSVARAEAVQGGTFAGVHVQLADPDLDRNEGLEDASFCAVMVYDGTDFSLHDDYESHRIPGNIAFGELKSDFVDGSGDYQGFVDEAAVSDFTTFTIVFSPAGAAVKRVEGGDVIFDSGGLFAGGDQGLWDWDLTGGASGEAAATAVTMFEYTEFIARDAGGKADYLNEGGQFLPLNVYTGQLFPRE